MRRFFAKAGTPVGLLLVLGSISACTDIVYRDRAPYNPPPDATVGFLGYFTAAERQTTCGNCHVGQQGDWVQTLHAAAWDTLKANAAAQPVCEGCHTVNTRGNRAFATAGYDLVKDAAYHDVQCESCHGPGLTHVQNPTVAGNRPLASINVFPSVALASAADTAALVNSSCAACHQAAGPSRNHNYLKEWRASRHGQLRAAQAGNVSCQPCHEGKGALAAWGINTVYKEKGSTTLIPQNCVVCHDPHGSAQGADGKPLDGQLRFPISEPRVEVNLCTKCHSRTSEAAPNASRGPHGAQGPVLFGTAGYFPPGTAYDTAAILTSHGSSANPRLCAGCHVNKLTGVDAGGNQVSYVGHSFHPLPCLTAGSQTVVDTTYTNDCAYTATARSWAACTASGCHPSTAIAVQRLALIKDEKQGYINTIWVDKNNNDAVDATDGGYLAKIKAIKPNELNFTDTATATSPGRILTAAKGALFNVQLLGEDLASHPDGSHGVHNPFLTRTLLQSSIANLLATYPTILPAPPAPVLAQIEAALTSRKLRMAPATEQVVHQAYAAQMAQRK